MQAGQELPAAVVLRVEAEGPLGTRNRPNRIPAGRLRLGEPAQQAGVGRSSIGSQPECLGRVASPAELQVGVTRQRQNLCRLLTGWVGVEQLMERREAPPMIAPGPMEKCQVGKQLGIGWSVSQGLLVVSQGEIRVAQLLVGAPTQRPGGRRTGVEVDRTVAPLGRQVGLAPSQTHFTRSRNGLAIGRRALARVLGPGECLVVLATLPQGLGEVPLCRAVLGLRLGRLAEPGFGFADLARLERSDATTPHLLRLIDVARLAPSPKSTARKHSYRQHAEQAAGEGRSAAWVLRRQNEGEAAAARA